MHISLVFSCRVTYHELSDNSEWNYHARIATRSNTCYVETLHLGVECCGDDDNAEIVAGILLLCTKDLKGA